MKKYNRIIVLGDGWSTVAELKEQKKSSCLYMVSTDDDVLCLAEKNG